MKKWTVQFSKYAQKDYIKLDNSQRVLVDKAILKVSYNPLSKQEGGYGVLLSGNLKNLYKIKLLSSGIRIIYQLIKTKDKMEILVIGMRKDEEVYKTAVKRIKLK